MRIINFDSFSKENFGPGQFGGHDAKFYARFDNCEWMVKRAYNSIADRERLGNKNFPTYDSSCQNEWLGSKFYEMFDIPVQETIFGKYKNKDVIACSYIYDDNTERLIEMRTMLATMDLKANSLLRYSPGNSKVLLLTDIFKFMQNDERFNYFRDDVINRFWDMFVIDAFIGNHDRHMGNWALIQNKKDGCYCLAPVYDNGSAFCSRWNEQQFENYVDATRKEIKQIASGGSSPYVIGTKRINSLQYMLGTPCLECVEAMFDIIPKINFKESFSYIDELHNNKIISQAKSIVLKKILVSTMDDFLFPAMKRVEQRINKGEKFKSMKELIDEDEEQNRFQEKIEEEQRLRL